MSMLNDYPYQEEWDEAIRLLHKFVPESKALIRDRRTLNMDNICQVMEWIDPQGPPRVLIDTYLESLNNFNRYFGAHLGGEHDRVLVIPDLGSTEKKPFVCAAKSLCERIDEGCEMSDIGLVWEMLDGTGDVLFVFETTGKMLLFDHHEGVCLASPYRNNKKTL